MSPLELASLASTVLDWVTVAVFAVTGALVASRKQMDIFGFCLLGLVTGIGGGTLREVLLGTYPLFWVEQPYYVIVCVVVSVIVFFTAHIPQSRFTLVLWLDAVGISLVCVTGANHSLIAGTGPTVAVVMGAITATAGGMIRDVLGGDSPVILRREIYVTAAIVGASVFVLAEMAGAPHIAAMMLGGTVCFVIRGLALYYRWSLPAYKARPGRDPADLGY
jgi:uncharacterized membrane protein YeiH